MAGEATVLTLDFDAAQPVVVTGQGAVRFKPVVKLLVRKSKPEKSKDKESEESTTTEGEAAPSDDDASKGKGQEKKKGKAKGKGKPEEASVGSAT